MTDYKEQQTGEIEALESIYSDELKVLTTEPYHVFEVTVTSTAAESHSGDHPVGRIVLQFTYTPSYPDEAPVVEITEFEGIENHHVDDLMQLIKEVGEESIGEVMVFTLVSAIQERLSDLVETAESEKKQALERRLQEQEEAERRKFEGTRVTVESFLAWKTKFDAEMEEIRLQQGQKKNTNKKLTGKELFMQDHTFDDSDMKFLEDETVQVDETLFQDMDDLDLDDEDLS